MHIFNQFFGGGDPFGGGGGGGQRRGGGESPHKALLRIAGSMTLLLWT